MRTRSHLSRANLLRFGLFLASTGLTFIPVSAGLAQPAPPPPGTPDQAGGDTDPPTLAGRLAAVTGTVSTHAAGQTEWVAATLNSPVTNGDSFWTEPQASATIEVGADNFVMNEATELDVTELDQSQFSATAAQGELYLGLPNLPDGQNLTINTPRGEVKITATGQYDIVAGDTATPTTVTVVAGSAIITGAGVNLTVGPQQTATIEGSDQFTGTVAPAIEDDFLRAQMSREQAAPVPASAPPQVQNMTGCQDLARYGAWQTNQQYGNVWYPNDVSSDWAPYSDGQWSYVGPWGWTWVDNEPWGFAPFHYGRWVTVGGRWGWVAVAPDVPFGGYPVYAPALVGFVGFGGGVGVGLDFGFGGGFGAGIGWVPLGFREPFVPWYHASDRYFQRVNRFSGARVTNINNYRNITINHYANARFARGAPERAFTRGERMNGVARPIPAAAFGHARPIVGRLPVRPGADTPGLTRADAARFHVAAPAHPAGRREPGPAIHPGREGNRPALRPAGPVHGGAEGPHGGAGPHPGAPGPHIGPSGAGGHAGLPALRPAGDRNRPPPIAAQPGAHPGEGPHPGAIGHPGEAVHPGAGPHPNAGPHPGERPRPGEAPHAGGPATHPGGHTPPAEHRPEAPHANLPHVNRPEHTPQTRPPYHTQEHRPVEHPAFHQAPHPSFHHESRPAFHPAARPAFHPPPRPAFHPPAPHAEPHQGGPHRG